MFIKLPRAIRKNTIQDIFSEKCNIRCYVASQMRLSCCKVVCFILSWANDLF